MAKKRGKQHNQGIYTREVQTIACNVITQFTIEHQYAPSVRELAEILCYSLPHTHTLLQILRAKGRVTWQEGCPRTIAVIR